MSPSAVSTSARARAVRAAIFALCALPAACSPSSDASNAPKTGAAKRREPARVRVVPVEQREMVSKLQTTTVVQSEKEIQIFPRASGIVTEILAAEGDRVEAGQVLAVLDDREARAIVAETKVALAEAQDAIERAEIAKREAEARIHQTKLEWEQATRDHDRNEKAALISQQALEALRTAREMRASDHESARLALERTVVEAKAAATALEKAKLALARAELELSYTRIEAPIAGLITARSVRVGGTVGRGTSVIETAGAAFVLTDPEDLHVQIHRPQRELAWFLGASGVDPVNSRTSAAPDASARRTLEIHATAEALPGAKFRGSIDRISPAINPQSGSFTVHARIESTGAVEDGGLPDPSAGPTNGHAPVRARLLPGMLVRLEIVTDRHPNALVVPKRCLRREGEASLIFTVRDGRARRIEVQEGFSDDLACEVTPVGDARLAAGDLVVVVGNRELEDGSEVSTEQDAATTPPTSTPPADEKQ